MPRLRGEVRKEVEAAGEEDPGLASIPLSLLPGDTSVLGGAGSPGMRLGRLQDAQLISCDKFQGDPTLG